jgi:uncharacterized protein (DUF302 family)
LSRKLVNIYIGPCNTAPGWSGITWAGLELPLRVLAWEAEDGLIWLGYNSPQTIVDGLDLHDVDDVTCMMTNALDALTE